MSRSGNSQRAQEGYHILHELEQLEDLQLRTKCHPSASTPLEKGRDLILWTSGDIRDEQVGADREHAPLFHY